MKSNVRLKVVSGKLLTAIFVFSVFHYPFSVIAQSGGQFSITQSAIANGGGQDSTGGTFNVSGTVGQPAVGIVPVGPPFLVRSGFWHADLAPTSAGVSISGRVLTTDGRGLRNAVVSIANMNGSIRITRTSSFGYFRFEDIDVGQTVVITVLSKNFLFDSRILNVVEDLSDLNFQAVGNNGK